MMDEGMVKLGRKDSPFGVGITVEHARRIEKELDLPEGILGNGSRTATLNASADEERERTEDVWTSA